MKARLITRCGCERTINISSPPPPEIHLPLLPPKNNEGRVRQWMGDTNHLQYDPMRDGPARVFRVSLESLDLWRRYYQTERITDEPVIWYDESTVYDPPGWNADKRTYNTSWISCKRCGYSDYARTDTRTGCFCG